MSKELVTTHLHQGTNRVKVHMMRKFNLGNYQTLDLSAGLETDQERDENLSETFERAEKAVETEFKRLCEKVEGKSKGGK